MEYDFIKDFWCSRLNYVVAIDLHRFMQYRFFHWLYLSDKIFESYLGWGFVRTTGVWEASWSCPTIEERTLICRSSLDVFGAFFPSQNTKRRGLLKQAHSQEQFSVKIWAETIECFCCISVNISGVRYPLEVLIQTCALSKYDATFEWWICTLMII
jgi:hypothetical protein